MLRKSLPFIVVAAAVLLSATIAPAANVLHLQLDKSMPEADQAITESPDKIVLEFSQRPELAVSRLVLKTGDREIDLGDVTRDENDETILWSAVQEELAAGVYTLNWTTASSDGHPVRGEFSFTLSADR